MSDTNKNTAGIEVASWMSLFGVTAMILFGFVLFDIRDRLNTSNGKLAEATGKIERLENSLDTVTDERNYWRQQTNKYESAAESWRSIVVELTSELNQPPYKWTLDENERR